MDKRFYVYEFIRLDTGEPFYVGKGCGNRVNDIHRGRSEWFKNTIKAHGTISRIIADNLTEKEAYEAEVWYIYEYKHLFNYKLVNLDDGGYGAASGDSNPMYGRKGNLSPLYGRKATEVRKQKISKALEGKKKSEEHKLKLKVHCLNRDYSGENNPNFGNGAAISGENNPSSIKIRATDSNGSVTIFASKEEVTEQFRMSYYLLNKLMGKKISVEKDFNREKNKYRHLEGYKFDLLNEGVTTSRETYTIS